MASTVESHKQHLEKLKSQQTTLEAKLQEITRQKDEIISKLIKQRDEVMSKFAREKDEIELKFAREKDEIESELTGVIAFIPVVKERIDHATAFKDMMERQSHEHSASKEGETPAGQMGIEPPPAKEKKGWLWGGKRTHKRRSKRLYRK